VSAGGTSEAIADLDLRPGERWYVAHTLPSKEATVAMRLAAQGFRNFLPRRVKTVRHARRMRQVNAPVFPRYIFVALDLDHDQWRSVNGTIGVSSLFMAQDRPLPAPAGVVETLIMSADRAGRLRFAQDLRKGDKVRLVNGPFADALGVLDRLDNKGRIEVLLDIMGKGVRVGLREEWVEPAA
jgi:transcription elongation factor/antiterminator RfaH